MHRCSRLFNSLLGLVAEMQVAAAAGTPNLARSAGLQAGRLAERQVSGHQMPTPHAGPALHSK